MGEGADLPPKVLISGHARLPQEAAAKAVYDILAVVAEVETERWTVVSVDSSLITGVARSFLGEILSGRSLLEPVEGVLQELELAYYGGAKRAVLAAVRELYERAGEVRTILGQ